MGVLILMRHGKSMWNLDKSKPDKDWAYAGAADVPLSESGIQDALRAGKLLSRVPLDVVYCSMLIRAQTTALIALASREDEKVPLIVRDTDPAQKDKRGIRAHKRVIHEGKHQDILPMYCSFDLNERSFGDIQGMFKAEQTKHYSEEELLDYRTDWDTPFPGGESSAQVYERTMQFFKRHIEAQLLSGKNVLLVCHGFVVRVLIAHLNNLNPTQWKENMLLETRHEQSLLTVNNAEPVFYEFDENGAREIKQSKL